MYFPKNQNNVLLLLKSLLYNETCKEDLAMKAIAVEALVKDYGKLRAVDNISFEVEAGEIFGLIGPNGAGKTTTLRILSTILNKTSGSVKIFGFELGKDDDKIRKIISYLPEEAGAYKNLTGLNYLEFMADFYAVSKMNLMRCWKEELRFLI